MPRGHGLKLPQEAFDRMGHELDTVIARDYNVSNQAFGALRRRLGIPKFKHIPDEAHAKLGKVSDQVIADEFGVGLMAVNTLRRKLGIPSATQQGYPDRRGHYRKRTPGLENITPGERQLWRAHVAGAEGRGWPNELTPESYVALCKQDCRYCGRAPELRERVAYVVTMHGADRVDNTKGYTLDNCVSCCFECNRFKGAMTSAEFIEHCRRIVRHNDGERGC